MRTPARYLQEAAGKNPSAAMSPPEIVTVDSDVVVILAALLCALICVIGLALVARCAWLRRSSDPSAASSAPNKGLKKKTLRALPKLSFDPAAATQAKLTECPICLAEFAEGDEIRILPQCGHGFHVHCVDKWLGSHSSCPSCRQVLVLAPVALPSRCQRCGACSDASAASVECGAKAHQDTNANRFTP